MTTTEKWIVGILSLVAIVFVFMAFIKPTQKIVQVPPTMWPAGCNPENPGYDMEGNLSSTCVKIYCALNPNDVRLCNAESDCFNGCSSSRPGYDCAGNRARNC